MSLEQHNTVASWQARYLGISGRALQHRLIHHGWRRLYRGALATPSNPSPLQDLTGALLVAGRPESAFHRTDQLLAEGCDLPDALVQVALFAGQTAYGQSSLFLRDLVNAPDIPFVRVPQQSGRASRIGLQWRFGELKARPQRLEGLAASSFEVAVVEYAAELPFTSTSIATLAKVLQKGDRRRYGTLDTLLGHLEICGPVPGTRLAQELCDELNGQATHSQAEKVGRRLATEVLQRYGLVLEPRPYKVEVDGEIIGEADLAVLQIRYDMEIDGPIHQEPDRVLADQQRDLLMRRAGWEVERFPVALIDAQPRIFQARVDATVRGLLDRQDRAAS